MELAISGGDAKETSASRGQHAEYGGRWHGARAVGVGVGWKDSPKAERRWRWHVWYGG